MSERAYLLIVSVVFLLFTLGNVLQFIFIPWALEPAWPGPHCCCCHRLFVVRRVPLRAQVATEGMKSWHGCRLSLVRAGPASPSGSMRERYTERLSGGRACARRAGGGTVRRPSPAFRMRGRNAVGDS